MRERVQLLFTRSILFLSLFVLHFSFPFFVVYSKDSRLWNPPPLPSLSFSIFFFPSSLPLSLSLHSLRIIFSMTMSLPETYFFATRALRKGTTLHLNTAFFAMSWKCVTVNGDASPTITRTIYFTLVKAGLNFISARLPWGEKTGIRIHRYFASSSLWTGTDRSFERTFVRSRAKEITGVW